MKTRIIEATHGPLGNWGRFMVGRFDTAEWEPLSKVANGQRVMRTAGRNPLRDVLVLDLVTGEGAIFALGGLASADLHKHQVWVCPLFEPFLTWLYGQCQAPEDIDALPPLVTLTFEEAPFAVHGYRRPGK